MNEVDRKTYRPAPKAGEMKCQKCGGVMVASSKNPKVSCCTKCGHQVIRTKLA